jgi:hypothetical protein
MLAVQKEWQELYDSFDGTWSKDNLGERNEMLDAVLNRALSKEDLRSLAATCDSVPLRVRDQSAFQWQALEYMVRAFVKSGDRDGLVSLLSRRFPNGTILPREPIEFYLAYWGRKTLKDPILVLGEAYAQCRVPEVRRQIAFAVRASFAGSGIRGKDDAELVSNAMKWYEKEKEHLTVSELHMSLGLDPPHDEDDPNFRLPPDFDFARVAPLFVGASASPGRKGK